MLTANDNINGNWNYSYDQFNRLACSNLASNGTCASPTSGTPTYSYVYDRFGNRWQQNGQFSFSASFTGNSPAQPANNNRMDGYTYDAAGNLLSDGNHTYFYDAENRLIQVDGTLGTCSSGGTAGTTACYYYDAEGHRVWRTGFTSDTCDATGKRGYVFDLAGHWVAEVNGNGGGCNAEIYAGARHVASQNDDTMLDHTDWLGTSRLRTDYQYTTSHGFLIAKSCTSLPFGDATSCHGGAGSSPLVFTGKELDNESGLDNFGARFDSSSMGRFMSSDPGNAGVVNADPQSWNAYAYVRNNPINLTDPTGAVFCRPANDAEKGQGVSQVCDVTDAQYVNSSKADQAAYDKAGYTHFDCSCDTNADKAAWAERKGNTSPDYVGYVLVFIAALDVVRAIEDANQPQPPDGRLPQDRKRQEDYPNPPEANNGDSPIGTNPNQAAAVARDRAEMEREGYTDIRQNQEQVNAQGIRVGRNKPDLQGTDRQGIRHYIEYDQDPTSGAAHAQRIRANDPAGVITTKTVK